MLRVNDISFSYQSEKPLLKNISLSLKMGEHLCVMGESGSGKSTLLKIIYGLLDVEKGSLYWKDNQILGPAFHLIPGMEYFKYVAQDFDLMPFTTVSDNISKFLSRIDVEGSEKRTRELLEIIDMTEFAEVKVKSLSGGQKQRVAIARALAKEPELLLLDEPFGQIDQLKRNPLRRMLFSYLKEKQIACIVATHDSEDALSFSDKMLILQDENIIAGTPHDIYRNPPNKYVASFFDDINEITLGKKKELIYPHQIKIVENSDLKAIVQNSYFKGFYWLIQVKYKDQNLFVHHNDELEVNREVSLLFAK